VVRLGNRVIGALDLSPYTNALARLGKIRSAGITDLRYGNLLDDDWYGRDRFEHSGGFCLAKATLPRAVSSVFISRRENWSR
jgi:hypothetical protein